jgi:hypothetical protein
LVVYFVGFVFCLCAFSRASTAAIIALRRASASADPLPDDGATAAAAADDDDDAAFFFVEGSWNRRASRSVFFWFVCLFVCFLSNRCEMPSVDFDFNSYVMEIPKRDRERQRDRWLAVATAENSEICPVSCLVFYFKSK